MKVVILGCGAVGSVLVKLLAKEKSIERVICGDIVQREKFNNQKIKFVRLDILTKRQFYNFLKKAKPDVVVNASSPLFNLVILEACYENKINYMDLAAQWDPDTDKKAKCPYKTEQFDYDKKFKEKNISGLILAGVSPGMTNLFAREASEQLDEIDSLKIRLVDYSGTDELSFFWSKEALLDEIDSKPLIYKNNKFEIMEPFSGVEEFDFPKPFGKKKVNLICQDEIGTLPFFINAKNIDIKDYDNQVDIQKTLYELGFTSKNKIKTKDGEIAPIDLTSKILPPVVEDIKEEKYYNAQFAFVVRAEGRKKGKAKMVQYWVMFPKQKEINNLNLNANFISYPTALSAKMFVMAIPKITQKGVFPPEALEKDVRKEIIQELEKTDVKISRSF